MSQVKHFLVFIITPAIPHGAFKMEVTFCVKAVYTPVLAKHLKNSALEDSLAIDRFSHCLTLGAQSRHGHHKIVHLGISPQEAKPPS